MCNYRPISLLNVISKIFEQVVYNQLYEYFTNNNLFFDSQYGFRSKHSTEDAAIELVDQVHNTFENNPHDEVLSVFLDLSKAFDTIDHDILLSKLLHYGIEGSPLRWFVSYLTNRKQFLTYDDTDSELMDIIVGVPQGSILGPLIFLIYVNDACRSSNTLKFIHFADDTTLSQNISFFRSETCSLTHSQLERRINVELQHVYDWLCVNKLSLNVSKTRSMVFHNPKFPTASVPYNLEINSEKVESVSEFNFLGIVLDEFLTWKPHVKKVSAKISRSLGIIKRVRNFLPIQALKSLYNALIVPHLNYGLKLWGPRSKAVALIQKRAIWVITKSKFFAHTSPLFKQHKLLKLEDMYKLHCLKLHYKIEHNIVPSYISSLLTHNRDIHSYYTRGRDTLRPTEVKSDWLRHSLPDTILKMPASIMLHVHTSTISTFSYHVSAYFLNQYETTCTREPCLPCGRVERD